MAVFGAPGVGPQLRNNTLAKGHGGLWQVDSPADLWLHGPDGRAQIAPQQNGPPTEKRPVLSGVDSASRRSAGAHLPLCGGKSNGRIVAEWARLSMSA